MTDEKISKKKRVIDQYRDPELLQRKWNNATLMDDIFMRSLFQKDTELVEMVLKLILDKDLKIIASSDLQKTIPNLYGHSITLDVYARDQEGTLYDIEIQQTASNFSAKRSRFYSSLIDMHHLKKNREYSKLPEKYVIFIMKKDFIGDGLPIYDYCMVEKHTGKELGDEQHIVYVNGSIQDDTPLGLLMADFQQSDPNKMHYDNLAERVRNLKHNKEGVNQMSGDIEKIYKEGVEEGEAKGEAKGLAKGIAEGEAKNMKALAKYLKDTPRAEAVKQMMAVFKISEAEAKRTLAAA